MATKTTTTKKTEEVARYLYSVGRRKTAIAQVRLYPVKKESEAGAEVNQKAIKDYFGADFLVGNALAPIKAAGMETSFKMTARVQGGGKNGQSDAIKLGVARALILHDALLRPVLKAQGFLKRDPRMVERKKAGLKKARRAPQWSKR